jgi:hypothetical protein
LHIFQKP